MEKKDQTINLKQLRVLNNPLRYEIFGSLEGEGPASVHELAQRMGVDELRLYYHVKLLSEHGWIKITTMRPTATKPEAVYAISQRIEIYNLDLDDPIVAAETIRNAEVLLKLAAKEYRSAVEAYGDDDVLFCRHYRSYFRMSPETRRDFERKLLQVLHWAESVAEPEGDRFAATVAVSPQVGRKP